VVFIIEKERTISDRSKELVLEINKGYKFRVILLWKMEKSDYYIL